MLEDDDAGDELLDRISLKCKDARASLLPKIPSHQELATDAVNSLLKLKGLNFKPKINHNKHFRTQKQIDLTGSLLDLIDSWG